MFILRNSRLILFLAGIAVVSGASCRSSSGDASTPAGLVVVNAAKTGTVRRVLVSEGTDVVENTVLIEIALPSNNTIPAPDANRRQPENQAQNSAKAAAAAQEELNRASVELQRIEPLVASGGAPQSHLDAARAEYQRAQERLDQLRRTPQNVPANPVLPQNNNLSLNAAPSETLVAVRAPVAGNVRVISVRVGQTVKAGQPVATVSATP